MISTNKMSIIGVMLISARSGPPLVFENAMPVAPLNYARV
jgi:hypothetical protein